MYKVKIWDDSATKPSCKITTPPPWQASDQSSRAAYHKKVQGQVNSILQVDQQAADGLKLGENISGNQITWPPATPRVSFENKAYVHIVPCDDLEAAFTFRQAGNNLCVVNAAGIKHPVAKWLRGDSSTESSLLTRTTMSATLKKSWYVPRLFPDTILYPPSVQAFQLAPAEGHGLPPNLRFFVDFISCALIERPEVTSMDVNGVKTYLYKDPLVKRAMRNKIRYILQTAVKKNVHTLILNAFGCDHGHPAEVVSEIFREALFGKVGQGLTDDWRAYGLQKVVFAIQDLDDNGLQLKDRKRCNAFVSQFGGIPAVDVDQLNKSYFRALLTAPYKVEDVDFD